MTTAEPPPGTPAATRAEERKRAGLEAVAAIRADLARRRLEARTATELAELDTIAEG